MSRRGTWNNAPERGKNEKREMTRRLKQNGHQLWHRLGKEWIPLRKSGDRYANPQ